MRFYKESGAELELRVFQLVKMGEQRSIPGGGKYEKSLGGDKPGSRFKALSAVSFLSLCCKWEAVRHTDEGPEPGTP